MVASRTPDLTLSTAVGSEPDGALAAHFQDVEGWIDEGLFDLMLPMNYTSDLELFSKRLESWKERAQRVPVVMGVMVKGDAETRAVELERATSLFPAIAVFAYHELFESMNTILTAQDEDERTRRTERRAILLPHLPPGVAAPSAD